jgi:hypothetical protein
MTRSWPVASGTAIVNGSTPAADHVRDLRPRGEQTMRTLEPGSRSTSSRASSSRQSTGTRSAPTAASKTSGQRLDPLLDRAREQLDAADSEYIEVAAGPLYRRLLRRVDRD